MHLLNNHIMGIKVAEKEDMHKGRGIFDLIKERISEVERRLHTHDVVIKEVHNPTPYALRYVIGRGANTEEVAEHLEEIEGVEILSLGNGLELVKDLGDANEVSTTTVPDIIFSAHDHPTRPLIRTFGPSIRPTPKYPSDPSKTRLSLFRIPTPSECWARGF
jgi:hypothetical protein